MDKVKLFKLKLNHSVYHREHYTVELELRRFERLLMMYVNGDIYDSGIKVSIQDIFNQAIPEFQRDADKWSMKQQIGFIENLITGHRPVIQLYTTIRLVQATGGLARCFILDGLQRLTAIADFINGKFKVFDGQLSFNDLAGNRLLRHSLIKIQIFTFESDVEACQFYIQLNKGITHSEEDIKRAEDYIAKCEPDYLWHGE